MQETSENPSERGSQTRRRNVFAETDGVSGESFSGTHPETERVQKSHRDVYGTPEQEKQEDVELWIPGPDKILPDVDRPGGRAYRDAPTRTVDVPEEIVKSTGGLFTRKGTVRAGVLAAARGAFLQRRNDASDADALEYPEGPFHDEEFYALKEEDTFIKSYQGFAEDISRRIYKRAVPEGKPTEDEWFWTLYNRTRQSIRRSHLLESQGPATEHPDKRVRDRHGRRFELSEAVRDASDGRRVADPLPYVRCTGPKPESRSADVWTRAERAVARREKLHQVFTHGVTTSELFQKSRTASGRRYERRLQRDGQDGPGYISVGRWREEEVGRSRREKCAVRVPWIVAEIDGRGDQEKKDRDVSDRLARRLLRRLDGFVDLSEVVCSYSGNASIHIRIPDGALGCPIYRDSHTATYAIQSLFDRICGRDTELREAIDGNLFRPGHFIRAIGTVHEDTGRQVVATDGRTFLKKPAAFLFSLSEPQFEYSPPGEYPLPRRAAFSHALYALLSAPKMQAQTGGETVRQTGGESPSQKLNVQQSNVPPEGGTTDGGSYSCAQGAGGAERRRRAVERTNEGVAESQPWGTDLDPRFRGRNWASLFQAHHRLTRKKNLGVAWRSLQKWNQRNDPPLDESELRSVFKSASEWRRQQRAP